MPRTYFFGNSTEEDLLENLRRDPMLVEHIPVEMLTERLVDAAVSFKREALRVLPKEAWTKFCVEMTYLNTDFHDLIDNSLLTKEIITSMFVFSTDILHLIPFEHHYFEHCSRSVLGRYENITVIDPRHLDAVIEKALDVNTSRLGGFARIQEAYSDYIPDTIKHLEKILASGYKDERVSADLVLHKHRFLKRPKEEIKSICLQTNSANLYRHLYGTADALNVFRVSDRRRWISEELSM